MSSDTTSGAVIALAGVLIGAGFKALLDVLRDELTGGRERDARLFDAEREAYASYFSALDDVRDLLDNSDLAKSEIGQARLECWRRINHGLAMIDILAPQNISDLAAAANDVAELPYEDATRIAAMEALTTAVRKRLGIKNPTWRQYQPPGAPAGTSL